MVDPRWFGAKGDGIHDDTKAVRKALRCLETIEDVTVYLAPGTYAVSPLKIKTRKP